MAKICRRCRAETPEDVRFIVHSGESYCPVCYAKIRERRSRASLMLYPAFLLWAWMLTFASEPSSQVGWFFFNLVFMLVCQWAVILPHELGHALTARLGGLRVYRIVSGYGPLLWTASLLGGMLQVHAYPFGGFTVMTDSRERGFRFRKFMAVSGGPLVNLLFIAVALPWLGDPLAFKGFTQAWQPLQCFVAANALILMWNLLPRRVVATTVPVDSDGLLLFKTPFLSPPEVRKELSYHYLMHGVEALEKRNFADALRWNQDGLRRFPEVVLLRNNLGVTQLRLGLYELSREEFLAVAVSPDVEPDMKALAQTNVAVADILLDRPDLLPEADRASTEAMARLSWLPIVKGTRGAVLIALGKVDEGLVLARQALEGQEDQLQRAFDACVLALGHKAKEQIAEGTKYLDLAESLHPACLLLDRARKAYGREPLPVSPQ